MRKSLRGQKPQMKKTIKMWGVRVRGRVHKTPRNKFGPESNYPTNPNSFTGEGACFTDKTVLIIIVGSCRGSCTLWEPNVWGALLSCPSLVNSYCLMKLSLQSHFTLAFIFRLCSRCLSPGSQQTHSSYTRKKCLRVIFY